MSDGVQLVTPKDLGKGPAAVVARWLRELDLADKAEKDWRKTAERVTKRYRGEQEKSVDSVQKRGDTYNILWANVETIRPTLYNSTPVPVVERRFGDETPLSKACAEVLRRALTYTVSCQDFDEMANLAVQDYLLCGRAVAGVKYVPTFEAAEANEGKPVEPGTEKKDAAAQPKGSNGATAESPVSNLEAEAPTREVVYEEVQFELKRWRSVRRGAGSVWSDIPWIAFELELERDDCIELFGATIGNALPLQNIEQGDDKPRKDQQESEQLFQRAHVWQIWDKRTRTILYICPEYKTEPCLTSDDEYNLSGFFNVPRPLYAVETSDSLVPIAEFTLYETLANELEALTNRMAGLAREIRIRGAYPKNLSEIGQILEQAGEGKLTPVENADEWAESGGLDKAIWLWPIDRMIEAYQALAAQREQVKGSIYECMGIADILRGASDPGETARAQSIKQLWGSIRLRRRQKEVQRFCRDLLNLAAELIASRFSAQTLAQMTGMQFPTAQQKAYLQQQAQQIQANPQMAQQIPPAQLAQGQAMLALPSWDEITQFLRDNAMRHFRIDVQTDSTIALQDSEDQADFAVMMKSITEYLSEVMPMVQQGVLPFDAAKAMLMGMVRRSRLGYEVEDGLSQMKQPQPPDPTKSPEALKIQAQGQTAVMVAQEKGKVDMAIAGQKAQATAQAEQARVAADVQIAHDQSGLDAQLAAQKNKLDAMTKIIARLPDVIIAHIKNVGTIDAAMIKAAIDTGTMVLQHELQASEQVPTEPGLNGMLQ